MDSMQALVNDITALGSLSASLITAAATFFLWRVTKTLAVETTRMAEAASQPHIVATLTPNRCSSLHFDLMVDNTGNSTAYDIKVSFDPPLREIGSSNDVEQIPLQNISVLKPGQGLNSYLSEYALLEGKVYQVKTSWLAKPGASTRQSNTYTLSMTDYDGTSFLGTDPIQQIAIHVKKLEENWRQVLKANRRMKLDVFTSFDRTHEQRVIARQSRALKQKRQAKRDESGGT